MDCSATDRIFRLCRSLSSLTSRSYHSETVFHSYFVPQLLTLLLFTDAYKRTNSHHTYLCMLRCANKTLDRDKNISPNIFWLFSLNRIRIVSSNYVDWRRQNTHRKKKWRWIDDGIVTWNVQFQGKFDSILVLTEANTMSSAHFWGKYLWPYLSASGFWFHYSIRNDGS